MAPSLKPRGSALIVIFLLVAISSSAFVARVHFTQQSLIETVNQTEQMALQIQLESILNQAAFYLEQGRNLPSDWIANPGLKIQVSSHLVSCPVPENQDESEDELEDISCARIEVEAKNEKGLRLTRTRDLWLTSGCASYWVEKGS